MRLERAVSEVLFILKNTFEVIAAGQEHTVVQNKKSNYRSPSIQARTKVCRSFQFGLKMHTPDMSEE